MTTRHKDSAAERLKLGEPPVTDNSLGMIGKILDIMAKSWGLSDADKQALLEMACPPKVPKEERRAQATQSEIR